MISPKNSNAKQAFTSQKDRAMRARDLNGGGGMGGHACAHLAHPREEHGGIESA